MSFGKPDYGKVECWNYNNSSFNYLHENGKKFFLKYCLCFKISKHTKKNVLQHSRKIVVILRFLILKTIGDSVFYSKKNIGGDGGCNWLKVLFKVFQCLISLLYPKKTSLPFEYIRYLVILLSFLSRGLGG